MVMAVESADLFAKVQTYLVASPTKMPYPAQENLATITFDFSGNSAKFLNATVTIAEYNPYTRLSVAVDAWTNQQVATASAYVTVTSLLPGRCMQV